MNSSHLLQLVKDAQTRFRDPATDSTENRPAPPSADAIARRIDHTLLKAEATEADLRRVCEEARAHRFRSVCVNSSRIALVRSLLQGSETIPIAVVGFPLGATTTRTKVFEAAQAIEHGAQEIDMVLMIGALKEGNLSAVYDDIRAVGMAAPGLALKVILETALLTRDEKIAACVLSEAAGARFVKTSTGFSTGGATEADVRLMRAVVGDRLEVKASGGIRTRADAVRMIRAGADRLGVSASVAIVTDNTAAAIDGY